MPLGTAHYKCFIWFLVSVALAQLDDGSNRPQLLVAYRSHVRDSGLVGVEMNIVPPSSPAFAVDDIRQRLARFWTLTPQHMGRAAEPRRQYLDNLIPNRAVFLDGVQVLNDELQLAPSGSGTGINWSLRTVVTTQAYTNCGDRIQAESTPEYMGHIGQRFATRAEDGLPKVEVFTPAGGGTDNGAVLFHVTLAHAVDKTILRKLYNGNNGSFVLVSADLMGHVGRDDLPNGQIIYGKAKESKFRDARTSCGAIIGTLRNYDRSNAVFRRIRNQLGEGNYQFLKKSGVRLADGTDITYATAAAIVVLRGMHETAQGAANEFDNRGVAHLTASLTVNIASVQDPLIYLARATVFQKEIRFQGFGLDAYKYGGRMDKGVLKLTYDGQNVNNIPSVIIPVQSPRKTPDYEL